MQVKVIKARADYDIGPVLGEPAFGAPAALLVKRVPVKLLHIKTLSKAMPVSPGGALYDTARVF